MINELKLDSNPFAGVKVDGVKAWKEDDERGFDEAQALTILTATLATPSHLISPEMKAARRWVPWICAYRGGQIGNDGHALTLAARLCAAHQSSVCRPWRS
jgi:hypothetical protein